MVKIYNPLKPFFSIVIPTYNCAELLQRALKSIFSQSFQNFEIIIIDNSSTDHTQNVLNSYSDSRLNVLTVKNNGIIAYSRNKGIEKSKGDWIAFLDSDDVWKPGKLERVKESIDQNQNAILLCHDEWHIVNGKIKTRLKYGPETPDMYERLLFKGNCLSTSAVCLRKDIALKSGGFSERKDFVTVEDYEYWIRLAEEGKFIFLNEVLGEWHTHGRNYSDNVLIHTEAYMAVVKFHLTSWIKDNKLSVREKNNKLSKFYTQAGRIVQKGKVFPSAVQYSWYAIKKNPFQLKAWLILILSIFKISY